MKQNKLASMFACSGIFVGIASASPAPQGMSSAWPAAVVLKATNPTGENSLMFKDTPSDSGVSALSDFADSASGFHYGQMLNLPNGQGPIEVDAISSGNAYIPALDSAGAPMVQAANRFLVGSMTVKNSAYANVFNGFNVSGNASWTVGSYYYHLSLIHI